MSERRMCLPCGGSGRWPGFLLGTFKVCPGCKGTGVEAPIETNSRMARNLAATEARLRKAEELLDDVWRSYTLIESDQAHLDHSMEAVEAYLFPAEVPA